MKKRTLIIMGVGLLLFLGIGMPVLLNWLHSLHAPFEFMIIDWEARDLISFYAVFFSGFIVLLTLVYFLVNGKDERRKSILPFIATTPLNLGAKYL